MAMEIRCSSATARDWTGEALVVGLFSDAPGDSTRELLKARFGDALAERMERRRFKAKPGESLVLELLNQEPSSLVLVGLGAAAEFNLENLRKAAAIGTKAASGSGASSGSRPAPRGLRRRRRPPAMAEASSIDPVPGPAL